MPKQLLSDYHDYDYSVLNTRLFMSCWLTFSLDSSVTSMRGLFRKLNLGGTSVDQSTFPKLISIGVASLLRRFINP